jgi:hypothetical protein
VKPLSEFYGKGVYCKRCVNAYTRARRQRGDERYIDGKYQRVAHLTLGPEEKERLTENAVICAFGWKAAQALHKMAFDPDALSADELETAIIVAAALMSNHE